MPDNQKTMKTCSDCGIEFFANKGQRFCQECRIRHRHDEQLRARQARKSSRLARLCKKCGQVILDRGTTLCPDCRKPEERPPQEPACKICGGPLRGERQHCAKCKAAMTSAYHAIVRQNGRAPLLRELEGCEMLAALRIRNLRKCRLSSDMIAKLAWYYDQPYNSYGKLRAYIEEYDQLPPDEFLKSARPNRVDAMAWTGKWGG